MDNFWAKILLFVCVVIAGLVFVKKIYNPQKEAQSVMADTSTQTLSAVQSEVEDTVTTSTGKASVLASIDQYYSNASVVVAVGNNANRAAYVGINNGTATILSSGSGATYTFTSTSSASDLKALVVKENYVKSVYRSSSGSIVLIKFDAIN